MNTRIKGSRIITPEGVISGYVYFEDGAITYVGATGDMPYDKEIAADEGYVCPGFIDIHTHGAMGVDFSQAKCPEEISLALSLMRSHGATTVLPTVTSSTPEDTMRALEVLRLAMRSGTPCNIPGVHLEGPFFSPKQAGAQNPELITEPRREVYEPILREYGDIISRWDYAPERDEGAGFCKLLASRGILPSAGHTDADYEDVVLAMGEGMRLITHLYSCTSTITRRGGFRHLGVTECAYLFDDLYAEIITDGKHLPPELLKLIFKLKRHDRLILVTDSLSVAGTDGREATVGGVPCIIEDGVCKLLDRTAFAGSVATADRLLSVAVKEAGLDITEAVKMLAENPARLFRLNTGALSEGKDADIVILDGELRVVKTFVKGE